MAGKKARSHKQAEKNPYEALDVLGALGDLGKGILSSFKNDVVKQSAVDSFHQITNTESTHAAPKSGDMKPGQEVHLGAKKQEQAPAPKRVDAAPAMNYHSEMARVAEYSTRRETGEMQRNVQQIMVELKKLVDSSSVLQTQFAQVAVEQGPVTPGKYHQNFFEWMLIMIRSAREKVQDSGAWLAKMQSKKKSRQYGSMAKKHGTSFTLSNERTVATQTG